MPRLDSEPASVERKVGIKKRVFTEFAPNLIPVVTQRRDEAGEVRLGGLPANSIESLGGEPVEPAVATAGGRVAGEMCIVRNTKAMQAVDVGIFGKEHFGVQLEIIASRQCRGLIIRLWDAGVRYQRFDLHARDG